MAFAPLSQTVFLTEDGSAVSNPKPVVIPPPLGAPQPTPVSISGSPSTNGRVGSPYSFNPLVANGSGPRTFSINGGPLLPGLAQDASTGAIIGSPTAAGVMENLTVMVTDNTGSAETPAIDVTIAPAAAQPISIDGTVRRSGNRYTFTARRNDATLAETRPWSLTGSTDYAPAALASDFGGAFPSGTVTFPAGALTAPIEIDAPSTVQPE